MSNKFENCPAKEFIKLCFADDSGKEGHKFWENFAELRVDVWEKDCPKIYNYKNSYDALPDPDVNSYNLYEAHNRVWNKQWENFNIPKVLHNKDCELKINEKEIYLGSDSIMSIYWHRTSGKITEVIKQVSEGVPNWKIFIREYLKASNTIGGFAVFPRHPNSINQRRGRRPIDDRFDLTLECIRRAYQYRDFYREDNNPLFGLSEEDKEFFRMFGSFENYTKFFCLDKSWVKEGKVLNLLNNEPLEEWDFNQQEPLPQNSEEWWTFYHNIMKRLDARNEQIKKLLEEK